ncbi:MAG: radical SAM family heme chaperone HemW [Clostridiales bacterium]|jgi:putative oxygen-independent coproporphyrinogen III oxidase|nr:radical SAM family heme chaperone HemW [Clostridiales bacterium]
MDHMLGVYIHIPFCASKCSYCDFYSLAGHESKMKKYQTALIKHIEEAAPQMEPYYIDTLYFGGGTPSFYGAKYICEIFNTLKRTAKVLKSSEVTVEMNPDSITREDLRLLKNEGVNRISLGIQSANDDILKLIGRRHTFKQAEQAIKMIRAEGFDNINIDLIYGLPSQTKNDWADTLSKTIALRPQHFSCYGLKIEDGTDICRYRESELLPSDDDQADMYLYMTDMMEHYGYPQYEISNFALPGRESKHNLKYWRLDDYMGFGPGAHSCVGGVRYSYVRSLDKYIDGVFSSADIIDEYEKTGKLDRASEYIMLGMRTVHGISKDEYISIYRSGFDKIEYLLCEYEKKGWAKLRGDRWSFTSSGFLLSNILIGTLLEAQSQAKMSANPWILEEIGSEEPEILMPNDGATFG